VQVAPDDLAAGVSAVEGDDMHEYERNATTRKVKRRMRPSAISENATENGAASGKSVPLHEGTSSSSTSLFQKSSSFSKLGLARWLTEGCEKLGMHYPTDVQVMCIPPILAGRNVAGNAKTGSGKTACYCLPILHHLSKDPYGVFALILTPVRELAFQVSENFRALGKGIGVKVAEVVGGREMLYQSRMISERSHVIVATPGRLADLLRGDPAIAEAFEGLRVLVLDEGDKLLTQTFEEPLAEIIKILPKSRQTLLFSATITKSIERLKDRFASRDTDGDKSKELVLLNANPKEETLSNMTQEYIFVPKTVQACYLHYLLKLHFPEESCIVFASTIDLCQLMTTMLEFLGFSVTGLHSLHSQRHRQACLSKFRSGQARILVATDVAGRGLDIPLVAVVINLGLPLDPDDYVHRAGRTARAGRPGLVVSVMTELDVPKVHPIEARIGVQLELRKINEDEVVKLLSKTTKARQRADLLLSDVGFEEKAQEHRAARKHKTKVDGKKAMRGSV
jgi:ATP-dependent RNA helicase DDX49/DBP8